jgi:ADP-heptose:LPS heptosyltransferase
MHIKANRDCKYFKGDEPCIFHKQKGLTCTCRHYEPLKFKIVIIQLGGIGDIIRSTPILSRLKKEYRNCAITWVSYYPEALQGLTEQALKFSEINVKKLQTQKFDLLLNFDKSIEACTLSNIVKAKTKKGFKLAGGKCAPIDKDAIFQYEMGINDKINMKNTKSYQEQIFNVAGLVFQGERYIPPFAIDRDKKIIGINTGCGERWTARLWSESKWIELARALKKKKYEVILLGGEKEHQKNLRIARLSKAIYIGHYPLEVFFALVNFCDIIITVPTMALHAAIALNRKIVLLNNIFNKKEFGLYGLGEIIEPDVNCLGCYKNYCKKRCLDTIPVKKVMASIERLTGRKAGKLCV